jgi:hypothetical protein
MQKDFDGGCAAEIRERSKELYGTILSAKISSKGNDSILRSEVAVASGEAAEAKSEPCPKIFGAGLFEARRPFQRRFSATFTSVRLSDS